MIILKTLFWVCVITLSVGVLVAVCVVAGFYRVVKVLAKMLWDYLFPPKMSINKFGILTDEDDEDLKKYYASLPVKVDEDYLRSEWD